MPEGGAVVPYLCYAYLSTSYLPLPSCARAYVIVYRQGDVTTTELSCVSVRAGRVSTVTSFIKK